MFSVGYKWPILKCYLQFLRFLSLSWNNFIIIFAETFYSGCLHHYFCLFENLEGGKKVLFFPGIKEGKIHFVFLYLFDKLHHAGL